MKGSEIEYFTATHAKALTAFARKSTILMGPTSARLDTLLSRKFMNCFTKYEVKCRFHGTDFKYTDLSKHYLIDASPSIYLASGTYIYL